MVAKSSAATAAAADAIRPANAGRANDLPRVTASPEVTESSQVTASPFFLDDERSYRRWREWKLDLAPRRAEDLLIDVADPASLTDDEAEALRALCRRSNMAIYQSSVGSEDKQLPMRLGQRLGLVGLDSNWLADDDGISSITPSSGESGSRADFIPYTDKAIRWHTDGYYNPPDRCIRGMLLHCVRPAASGGENALMDHEIAYILLRDDNPDFIRALSDPAAMTIPARLGEQGEARPAQAGPVFSVDRYSGDLHLRYTARLRNIVWRDDAATAAAVAALAALLDGSRRALPWIYRLRLETGMGLVCNNVLHDRTGFVDGGDGSRRLLYRARYYERVGGTVGAFRGAAETANP